MLPYPLSIRQLHGWFGAYCRSFLRAEREEQAPLGIKVVHCQRVRREMVLLARSLRLPDNMVKLAEICGLLHDIGRFNQFKTYRTFVDRHSTDHADLGLRTIDAQQCLHFLPRQEREWIRLAIANHNKAAIDPQLSGEALLLARMIRDADKLDIWRVFIHFCQQHQDKRSNTVVLGLPDSPGISAAVKNDVLAGSLVHGDHIQNQNDFAVMRLSWVFDINFIPSLQEIHQRDYLSKQYSFLPKGDDLDQVYAKVIRYLDKQLAQVPSYPAPQPVSVPQLLVGANRQ